MKKEFFATSVPPHCRKPSQQQIRQKVNKKNGVIAKAVSAAPSADNAVIAVRFITVTKKNIRH